MTFFLRLHAAADRLCRGLHFSKWFGRLAAAALALAGSLAAAAGAAPGAVTAISGQTPGIVWILPFVLLLLAIALFPLIGKLEHWWEHNSSKLIVALVLAAVTTLYICLRGFGFAGSEPGLPALEALAHHAIIGDYIPFMVLLFSLYAISGGIRITGDIPARPWVNTLFLAIGGLLASFVGTTGASMLLIRPMLQINSERKHVRHTVIFFIFIVSNIGGALLPMGDPPLFLGYLRGVPFAWTLHLLPQWATAIGILLLVYYIWDRRAYRLERPEDVQMDETRRQPIKINGRRNFLWLALVVLAVAVLVPGRALPGVGWVVPEMHLREIVLIALALVSLFTTPREIHRSNHFSFNAIAEVACLFIGIFITMQVPIEILKIKGDSLGITAPHSFFWAAGALSSFLDNAPTYVVFFELAGTLKTVSGPVVTGLQTALGQISVQNLVGISCGAVFMGANTYIGNGPNFLVKSIAEHRGVKMPGFFGYMLYSGCILIPLFILLTFIFF
jgi:Na+/H+ antiporter NhaD/arsenite permease-like protein